MDPRFGARAGVLLAALLVAGCVPAPTVGPKPGQLAPEFTLTPLDASEPWALPDQRGRVVILDLMGANCLPCRVEMRHLTNVANATAGDPNVTMLSVDMGAVFPGLGSRGDQDLRRFRDEFNATWPFAPDHDATVGALYRPIALPTMLIIAPDGTVHTRWNGGELTAETILAQVEAAKG